MKKIDFNDYPTILWTKEMEDPEVLKSLCQHISDYLLWGLSMPENNSVSDAELMNVFEGKVDKLKDLYKEVYIPFGDPGSSKIRDYKFFRKSFQSTNGTLLKIPFLLSAVNVSSSNTDKRIESQSAMIAAMLRNKASAALSQEEGQDYSFMRNEEEYVPSTVEKLMEFMNAPQQEEYAVSRILMSLANKYNIKSTELKINKDHFVKGKMYAYIDYHSGEPKLKHVPSEDFGYISPVSVEDMDDENISAWGVVNFISLDNALRIYGDDLSSDSSADFLKKTIDGVRQGKAIKYTPSMFHGQYYNRYYDPFIFPESEVGMDGMNYTPKFYRVARNNVHFSGYGSCSLLEHKVWFRVIKKIRCKLKVAGKNPTKEEIAKYRSFPGSLDFTLEMVDDEYVAKSGEFLVYSVKQELMEFVRLGHCTYLRVRKCPYQIRRERNITSVSAPVIGYISDEESLVSMGKTLSVFYNSFMFKAQELRNIAGPDDVLLLDELQADKQKWADILHSSSTTGTVWYNSTQVQSKDNAGAAKHLTRVQLTPKVESILKYFSACLEIEKVWDSLLGQLNQAGAYDSAEKVNTMIAQSGLIIQKYYWEHYTFLNMCVRRWADVVKFYYAEDKELSLVFDKGFKEVLRLSKDMSMYDYEVYMTTGLKALQDKEFIISKASEAVSSGQLGFLDFIQMYLGDSMQESLAIIKRSAQEMLNSREAAQQASQQAMQQKNQIDAQKMMVPIDVKKIESQTQLAVADLRYKSQRESLDFKENKSDIDAANAAEQAQMGAQFDIEKLSIQEQAKIAASKNKGSN